MTYISRSTDFTLFLGGYLIDEHHFLGIIFLSLMNVGRSDLYFTVQLYCLIILVLFAKRDSGEQHCPATALIFILLFLV